ncbi:MAG: TraR/DksA family transcriptional regulator [Candidatus Paceibacter sp.]|jgi:RNA polymerase-binding transcription factor DksA|nr:TraR/DksA family transcriptional regulator [Candidatus Paceibacter sp.]
MKQELIHFEQKLAQERARIVEELKGVGVHTEAKDKDDWEAVPMTEIDSADSNTVADRITSYESNDALVRDLEGRLREIDHATKRMEEGKYNICEVCGEEIEEERLEANYAARTCKKHINEKLGAPEL